MTLGHQSGREDLTAPTGMRLMAALVVTLTALWNLPLPAAPVARSDTTSPVFELRKGERYFRIDGAPAFVVGRNPVGVGPEAFAEHFQNAAAAGERFMRIHFTYSPAGEKAGEIHPDMLKMWDAVLEKKAASWDDSGNNTAFLADQLPTDARGYLLVKPGGTQTDVTGVFAAGDVVDSVYRQAVERDVASSAGHG
jgi:hypothetical protein